MPTIITDGAASAQGYGFAARTAAANYIEDVFSTYLYTGTGGSQTISNGVDLSTKGGMVWIKSRSAATNNFLFDTTRGAAKEINSNTTDAEATLAYSVEFLNNGFTVGNATGIGVNAATYTSWTFRKQAKFFDVVTYTGNGTNRTIAHNLGSVPGCIIVKCTSDITDWGVYHRSLTSAAYALQLNTTGVQFSNVGYWNSTAPTSSVFSVGTDNDTNANGRTYVAYLFAHDAGGFGASGSDNVISCGSYTGDGTLNFSKLINLGWEAQFVMIKTTLSGDWVMMDSLRKLDYNTSSGTQQLKANSSAAESGGGSQCAADALGFRLASNNVNLNQSGTTYIYIAIRRGPMKTPASGTSVFSPIASSAATGTALTTGFPVDAQIFATRTLTTNRQAFDRLRGVSTTSTESGSGLIVNTTAAEASVSNTRFWDNTSFQMPSYFTGTSMVFWNFRRAPGFFDVVCYTGNDLSRNLNHNLGVAPQLWIIKARSTAVDWSVGSSLLSSTTNDYLALNLTDAKASLSNFWNTPTATTFGFGSGLPSASNINASGITYVAYLFATLTGVSKVGSYTGTGTTQQINCGFTGGARFVLIKRTDSTGDWYVWDSARGIVAGNDPYLLLNSTAAEVTSTDYVDTYSAGFEISSTAPAAINANGGSFIFLAIA